MLIPAPTSNAPELEVKLAQDLIHRNQARTEVAPPRIEDDGLSERRLGELDGSPEVAASR